MKRSIAYISYISLFLSSCSTKESNTTETIVEEESTAKLEVSKEQFNINNMTLLSPSVVPFFNSIKTTGKVEVLPEHTTSISTYYPGYVKNLKLIEGEYVKKGQGLFTLQNPEYVEMQQDYLEAKEQLDYLKNEFERQQVLAKENITSQKNFLKAKSEYGITKARYESLKKKLSLMNISPASLSSSNLQSSIGIYAPITGYVSAVTVSQGKLLSPEEVALVITNTEHLQVQMMVFEQDIRKVEKGQKIKYQFSGSTDNVDGKVSVVSRTVAKGKNAISVHGSLNDAKTANNLYPGMFVKAEIITQSKDELGVPENCVIELDGKFYILVLNSKNAEGYNFTKQEVNVLNRCNGYVQIETLNKDASILSNGAFDLIVE